MKAISHFLRITVLGGVLFLTPIVVLAFILGKAFDLARRGLKPMATIIPDLSLGRLRKRFWRSFLLRFCAFSPACSPEPGRRSESWPSWSLPFCPRFLLMSI